MHREREREREREKREREREREREKRTKLERILEQRTMKKTITQPYQPIKSGSEEIK